MNYEQFHLALKEVFSNRFSIEYPSKTKAMDSYYFKIMNSIPKMFEHWKYKIDAYQVEIDGSTDRYRMIEDCKNAENLILWAFENIELSY